MAGSERVHVAGEADTMTVSRESVRNCWLRPAFYAELFEFEVEVPW